MSKTEIKIAGLLNRLQERLTQVGRESAQTKANLAVHVVGYNNYVKNVNDQLNRQWTLNASRAKNEADAMYALRESTQKGFDQVKADMTALLNQVQRLNERVGKVESQVGPYVLHNRVTDVENRLQALNGAATPVSTILNKVDSLDKRVLQLEVALGESEEVRKALAVIAKYSK